MDVLKKYIKPKPVVLVVAPLAYMSIIGLLHWRLQPPLEALLYMAGGVVGIFLLDAAETFFNLHPSPFRSSLFAAGFMVVSVFIMTSSANLMAVGLILTMYATLIMMMMAELRLHGNLDSWFKLMAAPVSSAMQRRLLMAFVGVYVLLSIIWIL